MKRRVETPDPTEDMPLRLVRFRLTEWDDPAEPIEPHVAIPEWFARCHRARERQAAEARAWCEARGVAYAATVGAARRRYAAAGRSGTAARQRAGASTAGSADHAPLGIMGHPGGAA